MSIHQSCLNFFFLPTLDCDKKKMPRKAFCEENLVFISLGFSFGQFKKKIAIVWEKKMESNKKNLILSWSFSFLQLSIYDKCNHISFSCCEWFKFEVTAVSSLDPSIFLSFYMLFFISADFCCEMPWVFFAYFKMMCWSSAVNVYLRYSISKLLLSLMKIPFGFVAQ